MKAIILIKEGGIENLVTKEINTPQPAPDEVLVKVQSISINPVDIKTRKGGSLYASLKNDQPVILGWDISGTVAAAGNEVKKFREGDAIFGMVNFPGHGRAYAEYVTAPAGHFSLKPGNCTHADAAATTLAALTAWQVLVHQAEIQRGQHVLIHAAAGGVGHFAVQLAKHFGAEVSGTASSANSEFLKGLGVDHFIDYTAENFKKTVQVDMVLDPLGGETTARSISLLKRGGTLVSIVSGVKEHLREAINEKNIIANNYLVHSSGSDMEQLADLLQQGVLKPHISHRFAFDDMAKAHQQIETGKTRGKIVIEMDN